MPILSAENSFRKGLVAMVEGDPATAATHFQSAILIERQHGVTRPQMRYLSYYGLSIAQSRSATPEAIQACETAARRDFFNPDLLLNLGRVFLIAGKTSKALASFERGLEMAPSHKALRAELGRFERRQPPPLSMIARQHPINKVLGKLRWMWIQHTPRWISGYREVPPITMSAPPHNP
jgi:tetratricopeptide (TPR) repeat protein